MKTSLYKWIGLVLSLTLLAAQGLAAEYKILKPEKLKVMLANKDFFLLDVHIPEQIHISGTDAFIDFRKIKQNRHLLPASKEAKIVVYCRGGGMSRAAFRDLNELGYTNVFDLQGGMRAYYRF
ncbi:MAG: rhodanese-like domain-containing protein [Desulfobacterales bacterium]